MMKVTKTTFNMLAANRTKEHKKTVTLQRKLKNGTWGKAREYDMFNDKTAEEVIARLETNNPGDTWRIAE